MINGSPTTRNEPQSNTALLTTILRELRTPKSKAFEVNDEITVKMKVNMAAEVGEVLTGSTVQNPAIITLGKQLIGLVDTSENYGT